MQGVETWCIISPASLLCLPSYSVEKPYPRISAHLSARPSDIYRIVRFIEKHRYRYTALAIRPCNANRNKHAGKINASQHTRLTLQRKRKQKKPKNVRRKKKKTGKTIGKKEGNRTAREKREKQIKTASQQLATKQMTPSSQRGGQQPYWVSNDPTAVGVGAFSHGLSPAHRCSRKGCPRRHHRLRTLCKNEAKIVIASKTHSNITPVPNVPNVKTKLK